MKKFILLSLIVMMITPVIATAEESSVIVNTPKEKIEQIQNEKINKIIENEQQLAPEYEYKYVKVESSTARKVRIGYASGQPSNGTVFMSPGGFWWKTGGSTSVPVSVSVSFGVFSVIASPGSVQSAGTYVSSPYVNQACKLLVYKDIEISKVEVYRKRAMTTDTWTLYTTEYPSAQTRDYLEVVRVY